jgi:hypothetical protein
VAVDFTLLEIPVTAYYQVADQWGIFGGVSVNLVIDDDDVNGSESIVFNLPIGFRYNISGPHSIEGFYEFGLTDLASAGGADINVGSSVGARYLYSFSL